MPMLPGVRTYRAEGQYAHGRLACPGPRVRPYVPAEQLAHSRCDPMSTARVPAPHSEHTVRPAADDPPLPHVMHGVEEFASWSERPVAHATHVLRWAAPPVSFPAPHGLHASMCAAPLMIEKRAGGHAVQASVELAL